MERGRHFSTGLGLRHMEGRRIPGRHFEILRITLLRGKLARMKEERPFQDVKM